MKSKITIFIESEELPVEVLRRLQSLMASDESMEEHYSYASNDTVMGTILDLIDENKFDEAEKALQEAIDIYGESPDTVGMSTRIFLYREILSEG